VRSPSSIKIFCNAPPADATIGDGGGAFFVPGDTISDTGADASIPTRTRAASLAL
jgi:hypothetical protein